MNRINIYVFICSMLLALSACEDDSLVVEPSMPSPAEGGSPFSRAAVDTLTLTDFRRTYGVGFSYDGIYGERCNQRDVRCRVLDLDAMREWEKTNSHSMPLFSSMKENKLSIECNTSYSRSEYVQETIVKADAEAKLIVFNGEVQASVTLWEGGDVNDFHCEVAYVPSAMHMRLDAATVGALIRRKHHHELLTPSFREAVDWLAVHYDVASVDSFLVRYGSHVVTRARAGGALNIQMTMKADSLVDIIDKGVLGKVAVEAILQSEMESAEHKRTFNLMRSADCCVTVKGGDLDKIPNELLHFKFGECPDLSTYVKEWAKSINYDPNDYKRCNLEMTDMEISPIWNFIPDSKVAALVKARVEGTADELIKLLGYQNFVCTGFQLPQSVTCKMGEQRTEFEQPAVTNIIASGRYVATVCRERISIPGRSGVEEVQVVYPIYNQTVNLSCGYFESGGKAYNIRWKKNECHVELDTLNIPSADGTIYMTYGVPGSVKYANVKYEPSHPVIGYEWPYAIKQDGSLDTSKPYYLTYKQGEEFFLRNPDGSEQKGNLDGLPNWHYKNGRMVRNQKYYYYWNPNEIEY